MQLHSGILGAGKSGAPIENKLKGRNPHISLGLNLKELSSAMFWFSITNQQQAYESETHIPPSNTLSTHNAAFIEA
uniref:Uncharacterized protein n=1 Tax=Arundo donax TaxID=35708 RepID=A0A0A9G133_ARUDO